MHWIRIMTVSYTHLAASMIVRGFLDIDIKGLPDELAKETKNLMDMSMEGM